MDNEFDPAGGGQPRSEPAAAGCPMEVTGSLATLRGILSQPAGVAIAYSGGMDSGFLALAAVRWRGPERVRAYVVASELMPATETERALKLAGRFKIPCERLDISVLPLPVFREHPPDRCYHCKREIFSRILAVVPAGWRLVEGSNLDDRGDYRPGKRALAELGVGSPLDEAGFTKAMIRQVLQDWGAADFIRPPMPCLATRIPFGTPVDTEKLRQVGEGEAILAAVGLTGARLRHHGEIARIEVPVADLPRAVPLLQSVAPRLRALGFRFVTLDVEGYRQGSMNR